MTSCPLDLCPPLSVCPSAPDRALYSDPPGLPSRDPPAFPLRRLTHNFTCDVSEHRCPHRCATCLKCVLKCVCYVPEPYDVQPDGWSPSEDVQMFAAFQMMATALPPTDPRPLLDSNVTGRSKARRRKLALRTDHDSC